MKNTTLYRGRRANIPTVLIILGATGDLIAKKIIPALFDLFGKQQLPGYFKVVGFSRRELTDRSFQEHVADILHKRTGHRVTPDQPFVRLFSYQQGVFERGADYKKLAQRLKKIDDQWGVCTNKLFYLAVPPESYEPILRNLHGSGLTKPCSPEEGWTRVIVEKPFGKDAKTAEGLDELLGKLFKEIQIYRIDHYLAKEMLQNILSFRFSNSLFEKIWSNQFIERIDISLLESIGVEDRGGFYDGVGAFRDVGQNHLLQMLALVTMEHPMNFEPDAIRSKRAEVLQTLHKPTEAEIIRTTFRAQYEGYASIKNVAPHSTTETYFKVRAALDLPRWQGVTITLESGKRMGKAQKEIIVTLKHPVPCLCPAGLGHYKNKIIFSLEPYEGISIQFWSKKPGLQFELTEQKLEFSLRSAEKRLQYVEEYEKLLLDCIAGDQTLFVSTEEIKEMWRFTDPVIRAWQKNQVLLKKYQPDSRAVTEESKFIDAPEHLPPPMRKEIGIIGLGKMGGNLARRLLEQQWRVVGFNAEPGPTQKLADEGLKDVYNLQSLVGELRKPRIVWLMVPSGKPVDELIFGKHGLADLLERGDIIIDGGNSYYKDSIARAKKLSKQGIDFTDVGVSGGPEGARNGPALIAGGSKKVFKNIERLFYDLATENGYQFFEGSGAGHFVKMVHNGIEYGMMQAIGEGFAVLKKSSYRFDLKKVADVYNHGSVVESRLIGWLKEAFEDYGERLAAVSGSVEATGEGAWTAQTAKALKVPTPVIKGAVDFRKNSHKKSSYTGKILSALRNQFGGHPINRDRKSDKKTK